MKATLIDGKKVASIIEQDLVQEIEALKQERIKPCLKVVLVGQYPPSQVYVSMKQKACERIGILSETLRLSDQTTHKQLLSTIQFLNQDKSVHGILVQRPLPSQIAEDEILTAVDPAKDVDGFHPLNVGKMSLGQDTFIPCTPAGVQRLLQHYQVNPSGRYVVIIGRSNIVGKPLAQLLVQKREGGNATVTLCHTGTPDLGLFTKQAEILIVAAGSPEVIRGEMIRPGAVVIDVGLNQVADSHQAKGYRLVGDVHFESAVQVARLITPVPGGVGPMTIAMLLKNTVKAAQRITGG